MVKEEKIITCEFCGKQFTKPKYSSQKFCSKECYYKSRRNVYLCTNCGKEYTLPKSYKRGNKFCSRECYLEYREKQSLESKSGKKLKRKYAWVKKILNNASCVDCGEDRKYLLTMHHIDGNNLNNDKSNLEIVCFNCHAKRHLGLNENGEYVYKPKTALTPRDMLGKL